MATDDTSLSYDGNPIPNGYVASKNVFDGAVGGVHAGYRIATQGFVVGAEADIEATSLRGTLTDTYGGLTASVETKLSWQGSLRARAGVSLTNSSLLYITGGLAFAEVHDNYTVAFASGNTFGATPASYTERFSDIKVGYTIGGGMEQAISSLMTARVEYRFTDFGTYQNNSVLLPGGELKQKLIDHAVRIGASNYF